MTEIWRDIKGYEEAYQVSNLGRVRSKPRIIEKAGGGKVKLRGRVLMPRITNSTGHVSVALHTAYDNKLIHVLVAEAFLGPRPEGLYVLHKNGIPADNRVSNLKYGTQSENMRDVYYHGGNLKTLTLDDIDDIRARLDEGEAPKSIAKDKGVRVQTIYNVKNGVTFAWYSSREKREEF